MTDTLLPTDQPRLHLTHGTLLPGASFIPSVEVHSLDKYQTTINADLCGFRLTRSGKIMILGWSENGDEVVIGTMHPPRTDDGWWYLEPKTKEDLS